MGLELLYRGKPSVVTYRISRSETLLCRLLQKSRYISLVNLLADKELFPEFLTSRCEAAAISEHVLRWLNDAAAYEAVCAELRALRQRVAEPGACERAAAYLLEVLERGASERQRPAA